MVTAGQQRLSVTVSPNELVDRQAGLQTRLGDQNEHGVVWLIGITMQVLRALAEANAPRLSSHE